MEKNKERDQFFDTIIGFFCDFSNSEYEERNSCVLAQSIIAKFGITDVQDQILIHSIAMHWERYVLLSDTQPDEFFKQFVLPIVGVDTNVIIDIILNKHNDALKRLIY